MDAFIDPNIDTRNAMSIILLYFNTAQLSSVQISYKHHDLIVYFMLLIMTHFPVFFFEKEKKLSI